MTVPNYRNMLPEEGEDSREYCRRLEENGYEEVFVRKALVAHYRHEIEGLGAFFEEFELARIRHITLLMDIHPNRSAYSLTKKVAKNLDLSEARARYWVGRFQEVGEVDYVGREIQPE